MSENLLHEQTGQSQRPTILKIFNENKKKVFFSIFTLIVILACLSLYIENNKQKKIKFSENYLQAKISLEKGDKVQATSILKQVVFENDPTYSSLSFFLIINEKLIEDKNELTLMFNHLIKNNKFSSELTDLLIYKKALFSSNFMNETELLNLLNPLLIKENLWHPQALILLGDFFKSKNENVKAREFYQKIFTLKNLHNDFYDHAKHQLALISND